MDERAVTLRPISRATGSSGGGVNDVPARERTLLEVLTDDLQHLRAEYGAMTARIQTALDRAIGAQTEASGRGIDGPTNSPAPPVGQFQSIGIMVEDLRQIAGTLAEETRRLERIA